jgi:plastocyanin
MYSDKGGCMNNKIFFGLLIIASGILVGWFVLRDRPALPGNTMENKAETTPSGSRLGDPENIQDVGSAAGNQLDKGGVVARSVVTYTDSGFAPQPLSIKKGSTVTFVNESSRGMWVASGVHPTHQLLPGFDQLSTSPKGGTYEYVFTKVGTWKYHNHVNPSDGGTVVVTE